MTRLFLLWYRWKVETVGDAYMVVAGHTPESEKDHATRVLKFAESMLIVRLEATISLGVYCCNSLLVDNMCWIFCLLLLVGLRKRKDSRKAKTPWQRPYPDPDWYAHRTGSVRYD